MSASAPVTVNPLTGIDNATCGVAFPCKTIAYAVGNLGAAFVLLSAGVFNESSVSITSAESLVIIGVPSATVFDCSSRPGPAFNIRNSTVSITGVAFQACSNPNAPGGALSASGSSVAVMQCSFVNCRAASGGAMSISGPGSGLYLSVQNSSFTANSASGGSATCPVDAAQPCSTWGGAVAAFEILNVTVSDCSMTNNNAEASVPASAPQYFSSRNAVAGGGCVSVLFFGNASGSSVRISGNTFLQCTVTVSGTYYTGVAVGNGKYYAFAVVLCTFCCAYDVCAGYGGALSVYFGLAVGLQLLDVAFFSLALLGNSFTRCTVALHVFYGGSVYGGGVSVYMGGYSSSHSAAGTALAATGDTVARMISVIVDSGSFTSCSVSSTAGHGSNAYGGSFSLYVGSYTWSYGFIGGSRSTSGWTTASGVNVSISNVNSSDSSANTMSSNSYGGSMSVVYFGAFAWSYASKSPLSSVCGMTNATYILVSISSSTFVGSSAVAVSRAFCNARLSLFPRAHPSLTRSIG